MLSVIIIDKRPVLRFGLKYFLEKKIEKISISDFVSLEEFFRFKQPQGADLIFLGVEGNIDLQKTESFPDLKKKSRNAHVIVYDTEASLESCVHYIKSGAHGYLSKTSNYSVLENCVEMVLSDNIYIGPDFQAHLIEGLITGKWESLKRIGRSKNLLTIRQTEIAILFAKGMTTSAIAKILGIQASTVSTVKSIIYAKLKVDSIVDLSKKVSSIEWNS